MRPSFLLVISIIAIILLTSVPEAEASTGLETIQHQGSTYYHAWNEGRISNHSWLNASSGNAQMATTEGQGIDEATRRMAFYKYRYGLFYMVGNHPQNATTDTLSSWQTTGTTDNATYWRTQSQKSFQFGQRTLTLKLVHEQLTADDFITVAMEYNVTGGQINLPNQAWLGIGLTDITYLNTVNYANDSRIHSASIGDNASAQNWLTVKAGHWPDGWAWEYNNNTDTQNAFVLENDSVWLLFKLGDRLSDSGRLSLLAIDEVSCLVSCNPDDEAYTEFTVDGDDNIQVPDNLSMTCKWDDVSDTCSINAGCTITAATANPYGTGRSIVQNMSVNPFWMVCNLANDSNGCEAGVAWKTDPVKGTNYTWQLQEQGRYNKIGYAHNLDCRLNGWAYIPTVTAIAGTDTIAPNVTACTINGASFTNNTIVSIASSNGSLAWANASITCFFDNYSTCGSQQCCYYAATGLVNVSGLFLNKTGHAAWNITDLTDAPYGNQTTAYTDLQQGKQYKLCAAVNGTNRLATTGRDTNWSSPGTGWCYSFGVNITTTPITVNDNDIDTANWRKWYQDTTPVKAEEDYWIEITTLIIVIAAGLLLRRRKKQ